MLDFGTGSGILAIAGHVLGCSDIVGVDIDDDALEAAAANIRRNSIPDGTVRARARAPPRAHPRRMLAHGPRTFRCAPRGPAPRPARA